MINHNNYIELAKSILESEIEGLKLLADNLDQNFLEAINILFNCSGKVIVSGMGKSGHVGRKIAATLASTGTSAFFVHPGEASHGDLGMITPSDALLLLSNSGETKELKDIIYYARRFSIPVISISSSPKSSLVKESDISLILPKIPEALNFIAPTTSTTMTMALGDAIALTLADKKGFDKNDFKVFHPGGRLGASFIKIKDLMHKGNKIPIANLNDHMSEILVEMTKKGFGCMLVVNNRNELEGIITDGNLRRHMSNDLINKQAKNVMTIDPITICEEELAVKAIDIMNKNSITTLPVVTFDKVIIGIVHIHDCLRAGINTNNL